MWIGMPEAPLQLCGPNLRGGAQYSWRGARNPCRHPLGVEAVENASLAGGDNSTGADTHGRPQVIRAKVVPSATPRFVVLTGAPHSGKTTLIEDLRRGGHAVVEEAALEVINELRTSQAGPAAGRIAHRDDFQTLIGRRQALNESAARDRCSADLVFLDRGLVDGLAYSRTRNEPVSSELAELVAAARYHRVFLLELVLPFDARPETGRSSDEVVALEVHEALHEAWSQFGLPPIRVPLLPRSDRLAFILERV